jgi:hypothetical protein
VSLTAASALPLKGSVLGIILHDVCEEIRLEELRQILGAKPTAQTFKHPMPEYVRFAKPPVVEPSDTIRLSSGEQIQPQIKYYDYGVVSVLFELPLESDWQRIVPVAANWVPNAELEKVAEELVRGRMKKIAPAMVKPNDHWLSEDYYIFLLNEVEGQPQGAELLKEHGQEIAQIVSGERTELAGAERDDILQARLSYYPRDLIVIGWNAALIYDTRAGAVPSMQILEYVNSQLLEFRYYDELLTRELDGVYKSLKMRAGLWKRWQMRREASRLNTVALEVTDLVERADTAIKFVSEMFSARLYRLAAAKVGVPEYKNLVNEKLKMSEGVYRFLIDEFHQSSGFVLELMVVVILIIELFFLFRGKG